MKRNRHNRGRILAVAVAVMLAGALLLEVALRLVGIIDFPIYDADHQIGYIPQPEQSGRFLRRNDWVVNERSMGSGPWRPQGERDILLLGDSLVWGGNPYDHEEKLGPLLQAEVGDGWQVWSAGAGSWSILNAVAYLERWPDVRDHTDILVWVLNTGDFEPKSVWSDNLAHPVERPVSAIIHAGKKYLVPRLRGYLLSNTTADGLDSESLVVSPLAIEALHDQLWDFGDRSVLVVIYPDTGDLADPSARYEEFADIVATIMDGCCKLLDVRTLPEWSAEYYRDDIHPTAEGNRILADAIAKRLEKGLLQ